MRKVNFIIGIHAHQPIGNFNFVFEEAFKKAYLPFIDILERYPFVKITVHYSGCLIEWLLQNHPDFLQRIKKLSNEGRIEIMSGGFYEPIFTLIPDTDKIGQIKLMNNFIREYFNYKPDGCWLTERVWEPYLARIFNHADIKYTVVDDSHFKGTGMKEENMLGYFVTEEEGFKLNIFPISTRMRYFIPFRLPEETINYFKSVATEEGNNLIVLADDGEKFGIWPHTYEWVYEKKWLESFFSELEKNKDWINITTFSEYLNSFKPLGRIYLPTASYNEMMEWAMPADAILEYENFITNLKNSGSFERFNRFVRGGFFRNFLTKYEESNNMHKKMLFISEKINKLNKEEEGVQEALKTLWRGQCSCAYWHGIFGGLYLNHLRFAIYTDLIKAEYMTDLTRFKKNEWLECQISDFDKDNLDEILVNSDLYNIYIKPSEGGSIFGFDYKPKYFNILDTLSRKKEAYHKDLFKKTSAGSSEADTKSIHDLIREFDKELKEEVVYDWYRKVSLIDHFWELKAGVHEFKNYSCNETGNFVSKEYKYKCYNNEKEVVIWLERPGDVLGCPCKVTKTVTVRINDPEILINYEITNLSERPIDAKFGVEFNFAMLGGDSPDRTYYFSGRQLQHTRLISIGEENDVLEAGIVDHWLKINISMSFSEAASVWRLPVETISQTIGRLEKVYQSSTVIPNWKISLQPGQIKKLTIKKRVTNVN